MARQLSTTAARQTELPSAASSASFASFTDPAPSSSTSRLPAQPAATSSARPATPYMSTKRAHAHGLEGGREKGKGPAKRERKQAGMRGKWWPTLHSRTGQGQGCTSGACRRRAAKSRLSVRSFSVARACPARVNAFARRSGRYDHPTDEWQPVSEGLVRLGTLCGGSVVRKSQDLLRDR